VCRAFGVNRPAASSPGGGEAPAPAASARKGAAWLAALVGLLILGWLLARADRRSLAELLLTFGLGGTLCLVLLRVLPIATTALGWAVVLRALGVHATWRSLFWPRLVGDYVNLLLPVVHVGGEVARGLLLIARGAPRAAVTASILVDMTFALLALVVFVLIGLVLLAGLGREADWRLLTAAVFAALAILAVFYLLQRRGAGLLLALSARLFGAEAAALHQGWAECERLLRRLYRDRRVVLQASGWRLLAWFAGALEIGVAVHWIAEFPGWAAVLAMEGVAQIFRNAGFAIPAALGAQEAGYVVGARLVGLPAEVGLALAVIKRARDLLIGIPVLCLWQWQWLRRRLRGGGNTRP
jgi:putative membrane protein